MAPVGRFDRDNDAARPEGSPEVITEGGHLPETLGTATEELRSTIEIEVARIVSDAKARATAIEDRALEKATLVEEDSERRLGAALTDSRQRLAALNAQIDAVEASLDQSLQTLRARTHELTTGLAAAAAQPFAVEPPAPVEEPVEAPTEERIEAPTEAQAAPPAEPPVEPKAEAPPEPKAEAPVQEPPPKEKTQSDSGERSDLEIREMIREQLATLAEVGRTRDDAKRMLLRFRQGERYLDLLDEIYPEEASNSGRKGLFRRRKAEDNE
jgi:hypothetical protein